MQIAALLSCATAFAKVGPRERRIPLRVVLQVGRERIANCVFSTVELAERAPYSTRTRNAFEYPEQIWGRCFLPDRAGHNKPGELVDAITIDDQPAWQQAYDHALPESSLSRSVPYHDVLRTLLDRLPRGMHRVGIVGKLKHGGRDVTLYHGEFRYVR